MARSETAHIAIVNGALAPQGGVTAQLTLVVPTGVIPIDLDGAAIDMTPLTAVSDAITGIATFDSTATPHNGLVAPQDVGQYISGVLTPVVGCYWQLSYLQTITYSPSYAYTGTNIDMAMWSVVAGRLGLMKFYLTNVLGSLTPIQGRPFNVSLSSDAIWVGGVGASRRIPGGASFPLTTDGTGTVTAYVARNSELNPTSPAWQMPDLINGGGTFWQAPDTYGANDAGVYNAGTTYASGKIVRRASDDEPFQSLVGGNVGNPLSDPTKWINFAGINIESIGTTVAPIGATAAISTTTLAHDSNVPPLIDDPTQSPLTLHDDLGNLAARIPGNRRTITTSAAISNVTDDVVFANATGGSIAPTLATAATRTRKLYVIKTNSANNVTITAHSGDTINGASTLVLGTQYQWAVLESDGGTAWYAQTGTGGGGSGTVTSVTGTAPIAVATGTTTPVVSIANSPTFTGEVTAADFKVAGLSGATAGGRYAGMTASGAPTSGTFAVGDWVGDLSGKRYTCTVAGTPGTWVQEPGTGGVSPATIGAGGTVLIDQAGATRALTTPRLNSANGVAPLGGDGTVPSANLPTTPGALTEFGRWTRSSPGALISPTQAFEATWVDEPTVLADNGKYRMWYGAGLTPNRSVGYAECPLTSNPTTPANWAKHTGPVWGQGGSGYAGQAQQNTIVKYLGVYYLFYYDNATGLRVTTSTDGISFGGGTGANTLILANGSPSWASTQWANPAVWVDPLGTWHMLVEANNGSIWQIGLATATAGTGPWSVTAGPFTAMQVAAGGAYGGPWVTSPSPAYGGLYQVWYHAAPNAGNLPTDLYRASSPDLLTWTQTGQVLALTGSNFEIDQVADPCVVEANGTSYLFYAANDNSGVVGRIKLATFSGPLAQLVAGASAGGGGSLSVQHNGLTVGTHPTININDTATATASVVDNGASNRVDIAVTAVAPQRTFSIPLTIAGGATPTFVTTSAGDLVACVLTY